MLTVIETTTRRSGREPTLLEGLLTREQLEAETGWGERTRLRREQEGLPYILLGRTKLYPTVLARKWILDRLRRPAEANRERSRKDGVTMLKFSAAAARLRPGQAAGNRAPRQNPPAGSPPTAA